MRRSLVVIAATILATASAAWAAYSIMPMNDLTRPTPGSANEVIEIPVPAEDMARCIATLLQVTQMPVAPDDVTAVTTHASAAPTVRCVVE